MADVSVHGAGDSLLYGVAGGILVSRIAAEHATANHEERERRLGFGLGPVRVLAHYEYGISQLAVRNPRLDRRTVLRVDVEADEFDFRLRDRACTGRCPLAFPVSNALSQILSVRVRNWYSTSRSNSYIVNRY
jgi:hypothetical protein